MKIETIIESITMNIEIALGVGVVILVIFPIVYQRVKINRTKTIKNNNIVSGNNSTNIQSDGNVKLHIGDRNEK